PHRQTLLAQTLTLSQIRLDIDRLSERGKAQTQLDQGARARLGITRTDRSCPIGRNLGPPLPTRQRYPGSEHRELIEVGILPEFAEQLIMEEIAERKI